MGKISKEKQDATLKTMKENRANDNKHLRYTIEETLKQLLEKKRKDLETIAEWKKSIEILNNKIRQATQLLFKNEGKLEVLRDLLKPKVSNDKS